MEFTNTNFGEEITYVIRIGKLPDLILSWIIIFLLVVELNFWGMYSAFEKAEKVFRFGIEVIIN